MKKLLPVILFLLVCAFVHAQNPAKLSVKTYRTDLAFNCITVDSANDIWAGTTGNGLIKMSGDLPIPVLLNGDNFKNVIIKGLAADGLSGIWVAHEGQNGSSSVATFGGVDFINRANPAQRTHYGNVTLTSHAIPHGLPTRRTEGIAIDKNGKVWTCHRYHDLTVAGGNPSYIVYPGGVGFKTPAMSTFDTIPNGLQPYPAYTVNTPISQSAGTRLCPGIGIGNAQNQVWVGVASYNAFPFQNSRICRWSLDGTYLGEINETNSPLPLGAANNNAQAMAIHFDKKGRVWVGFNQGKGIGVKVDTGWVYAGRPTILPAGSAVNQNAIASNNMGEVFIGTNNGLLIYKGEGAFSSDASYRFYTMSQGLPSNNITGVVVDKGGAVWVSTSAGIAKLIESDMNVYNMIHPVKDNELTAKRILLACATVDNYDKDCNGDPLEISVAADSSRSTLFVYTGNDPQNKVLYITSATVANDHFTDQYGQFELLKPRNQITDSLIYVYRAPAYVYQGDNEKKVTYTMYLKDTVTNTIIFKYILNIVHPPVLMVHGVWSSVQSFQNMEEYLKNTSGNYEPYQLLRIWYTTANHKEPATATYDYRTEVPKGIDKLLENCARNKISAGKVNILGHSRGGIFSRIYLQSTYPDIPYRNDVNKLITLNTPHSGSQTANLITDQRVIYVGYKKVGIPIKFGSLMAKLSLSDEEGGTKYNSSIEAANELRVDDPAIRSVLNGPNRLNDKVPKHAIITRYQFNTLRSQLLVPLVSNGLLLIPGLREVILRLRIQMLAMGTLCLEGPLNNCIREIYSGEENDFVVPLNSQRGGLSYTAVSNFPALYPNVNISHSKQKFTPISEDGIAVVDHPLVMPEVTALLRQNPTNLSAFTKAPFDPPTLQYTFLPNLQRTTASHAEADTSFITIDSALTGITKKYGDTVIVNITGSRNIKNVLVAYESPSLAEPLNDIRSSNNGQFLLPVPKQALGQMRISAIGFSDNGAVAVDTLYMNVGLSTTALLDSIRIQNKTELKVVKPDSLFVQVLGYYRDTVRDISFIPGLTYSSFTEGNAAAATYGFKGINVGYDMIVASYNGKVDTAYVEVTAPITPLLPLPVKLLSFSGAYTGNSIRLNWSTTQEINHAYFDITASRDGTNFTTIGRVAGNGITGAGNSYSFDDLNYKDGKNFYRLVQVDKDGKTTTSDIVLVLVNKNGSTISIYPNPAKDFIRLTFSGRMVPTYRLAIANAAGVPVFIKQIIGNSGTSTVPLPQLPAGLYTITIFNTDGKNLTSEKLVIYR